MPKRASCLIIGRHPQVPREVRVVCKQLTGILQLGDCCSHLNIKAQGSKIMTPPEFEAAAGCSKGKNWKVSFGALLQLVSGHASCSLSVVMHHAACQWSCIMQPVSGHASCSLSVVMQPVSGHASCSLSVVMHHAACQWSCIMQPVMGHASCILSCIMQLVSGHELVSGHASCIMQPVSGHASSSLPGCQLHGLRERG